MSKLTLPFFLILLVFWLVGATWWFNNRYDQLDSVDESACEIPFTVTDGSFQTKSENTIIFELSNWEPTIPMQTLASLKSVALYLENTNKVLTLTGWFGLDEVNNSDFYNNGIARADAIKNELVAYGAPENNITITSDSMEQIPLTCGKIMGGVDFRFSEKTSPKMLAEETSNNTEETTSESLKIEENDEANLLGENFNPEKTYIIFYEENTFKPSINEEIDIYLKSLANYLEENPKDRLLLMGHTDRTGEKKKHFNYGKYRARKLRDVLLEYGIAKRRIKTDSKGSSKPLATNKTKAGRAQNRRVEIKVIQR